MRNLEIYTITCYAEFRNSDCQKSNGNKFGFRKPGIMRKCSGNFNGITEFLLLMNLTEITRKLQKEPEIPVKTTSNSVKFRQIFVFDHL